MFRRHSYPSADSWSGGVSKGRQVRYVALLTKRARTMKEVIQQALWAVSTSTKTVARTLGYSNYTVCERLSVENTVIQEWGNDGRMDTSYEHSSSSEHVLTLPWPVRYRFIFGFPFYCSARTVTGCSLAYHRAVYLVLLSGSHSPPSLFSNPQPLSFPSTPRILSIDLKDPLPKPAPRWK